MAGAVSGYCRVAPGHPVHGPYHETEYGFPLVGDDALFERLALEINQAGLSWLTVLQKREALRRAFAKFKVKRVARFGAAERKRLLADAGIIRNRMKIDAIIENARRVEAIAKEHGSFAAWIAAHHPRDKAAWVKLFKQKFLFTGGEITGEFLISIGYLPGAHHESCPVYRTVATLKPPWMSA